MDQKDLSINIANDEDRQLAYVLAMIIWASLGIYLFVIVTGIIFKEWVLIAPMLAACALLSIPMVLLKRMRLRASSLIFMLITLATLTLIATEGQGIRDIANVAFPIIFIFAGLALERKYFRLCVGLALVAVCWLVFGEAFGWFVTKPLEGGATTWFYLIGMIIILLLAAFAVELLASNMRRSLERARIEVLQRKRAEEALISSEAELRVLFAGMTDEVIVYDTEGRFIKIAPTNPANLYRPPDEMLGKTLHDIFPKEQADTIVSMIRAAIQNGQMVNCEYILQVDGKETCFSARASRLSETTAVVVAHDITNRKKVEQALQENEEKFRSLFNNAEVGMFRTRLDGSEILDVNERLLAIFGLTREEMQGSASVLQWVDPREREEMVRRLEAEGRVIDFECRMLDNQGQVRKCLMSMRLYREQGILEGSILDITERKQAETALLQSEAELRALFASMQDVVLVIDRDGVYREIAPTNPGFLVKPPQELVGAKLKDVFPAEQAEIFLDVVQQVLDTKQTAQIEYDLAIGDRTLKFETSISPMTEDSTLWVARDITKRKRFESVQDAIYRITQTAITSEGIDALYHSIHSILGELIPAENFYIALIDPATNLLSFPYYVDQFDEPPTGMTQIQGLTGYVIRSGRPLLATRETFDQLVQQGEVEAVGTAGVDWMGAPLSVEGRMIGAMAMQTYTQEVHFDQEDLALLEFVSTQVAQAIERKRMELEIRSLSLTDELTGLYNRRGFTLMAEHEVKLAHRIKRTMLLFFGDVDNLKTINDTYGHAQGDLALKEVSAILKKKFREVDILARFGGDEFVVLALDASLESAEIMTHRLRAALEARNQQADQPYRLTLSLGIARYNPEAPCTLSELLAQADSQMYDQKQARKGKE